MTTILRLKEKIPEPAKAPNLTREGYKRSVLSGPLFDSIQQFLRSHTATAEEPNDYMWTEPRGGVPAMMTQLPFNMCQQLHETLQPQAEAWCGRKIKPTFVYGIRTYLRGAVLKTHVDRDYTHVVSVILNVDQKATKAWPLYLQAAEPGAPHPFHQICLAPGEVLFYEGNRLQHGRTTPFDGESFSNVFVHWALA